MASELEIFVDIKHGRLYADRTSNQPFVLPDWIQYSARKLNIRPVLPTYSPRAPFFTNVAIDNLTLKVAIGPAAGSESVLAGQYTWTKVYDSGSSGTGYFTAYLELNTTEMNSAVGSSAVLDSTFEIQFAESGYVFGAYQIPTRVRGAVIPSGSGATAPTPSTSYLTRDEVLALLNQFVRYAGNPAGSSIRLTSTDGTQEVNLRVDNDGNFSADPAT